MIAKASFRAFAAVLLLNSIFFLAALGSASVTPERVASATRRAFTAGALIDDDYLIGDRIRGYNQYDDCSIIQLIVNDISLFDDALAPTLGSKSGWTGICATLHSIVDDGRTNFDVSLRYTRYWHGYVPISTFLLSVFDLDAARTVLKSFVYLSLILVGISALRASPEVKIFAWSVAISSALFWAIPYFGQSFAHAPGDAFLMVGLAGFLFFSDRMSIRRALIPYSAAYGAGIAYLEFWTGQLPTATGLIFCAAYLVAMARRNKGKAVIDAWVAAGASALAFLAGAGLTVVSKQVLAIMLTDAPVVALFTDSLTNYVRAPLPDGSLASDWGRLSGLLKLLRHSSTLTFWSDTDALCLGIAVMCAWCAAVFFGWYRRTEGAQLISDLLAFAMGASAIFIWAIVFSLHTAIHATFMSRMLILPIAFGAAALIVAVKPRGSFGAPATKSAHNSPS